MDRAEAEALSESVHQKQKNILSQKKTNVSE